MNKQKFRVEKLKVIGRLFNEIKKENGGSFLERTRNFFIYDRQSEIKLNLGLFFEQPVDKSYFIGILIMKKVDVGIKIIPIGDLIIYDSEHDLLKSKEETKFKGSFKELEDNIEQIGFFEGRCGERSILLKKLLEIGHYELVLYSKEIDHSINNIEQILRKDFFVSKKFKDFEISANIPFNVKRICSKCKRIFDSNYTDNLCDKCGHSLNTHD